ncbi:MAG: succinate dehydrogenase [Casimicrobiaceae bacterium]
MTRLGADRLGTWLWVAQRASAAVLALCVLVHLGTIFYASRGGLTAAEILARTRGSVPSLAFYALFALAIAIHVPIGLRTVVTEWTGWRGRGLDFAALLLALMLLSACGRALWGLYR